MPTPKQREQAETMLRQWFDHNVKGKIIWAGECTAWTDSDREDLQLVPPVRFRVRGSALDFHHHDECLDCEIDLDLTGEEAQLEGYRQFAVYGPTVMYDTMELDPTVRFAIEGHNPVVSRIMQLQEQERLEQLTRQQREDARTDELRQAVWKVFDRIKGFNEGEFVTRHSTWNGQLGVRADQPVRLIFCEDKGCSYILLAGSTYRPDEPFRYSLGVVSTSRDQKLPVSVHPVRYCLDQTDEIVEAALKLLASIVRRVE
jgi:hypothetical protein